MKTYNQIKQEVATWADYNFDPAGHLPHLGIAEELGELAHALLKRAQGIRDQKDDTQFVDKVLDAIADTAIFALHWAAIHDIDVPPIDMYGKSKNALEMEFAYALQHSSFIVITQNQGGPGGGALIYSLFQNLTAIASHYDAKLSVLVNATWQEVSKRDWRKYPDTGLPPDQTGTAQAA